MKEVLKYIIVLFSITVSFAQVDNATLEDDLLKSADKHFQNGEFTKANIFYTKWLNSYSKIDSVSINAYFNRAYGNLFLNNHNESFEDLNFIISNHPDFSKAYFLRAKLQVFPKKRIEDLEKAVQLAPNNQKYIEHLALTKISVIAQKLDELNQNNKQFDKNEISKELFYAAGGCDLLLTLNKSQSEIRKIFEKYCSTIEIRTF